MPLSLVQPDPSNVTKPTPDGIQQQLTDVSVRCPETVKENLLQYINNVTSTFPDDSRRVPTWLIAEPASTLSFRAGELVAGAQDLVPALRSANAVTQNFFGCLASTNPGTQDFVREMARNDPVARELVDHVHGSRSGAHDLLRRVTEAGRGAPALLTSVAELGSPALDFLAGLAVQDMQPAAVGSWVPDPNLVGPSTQLFSIQAPENWQRLKSHFGNDFAGQENNPDVEKKPYSTTEAFEQLFQQLGYKASAAVVQGLAKTDTEAQLANRIKGNRSGDNSYDSGPQSLVLLLANGYDPVKQEVAGVGVLTVDYQIQINDYRNKSKDDHDRWATISIHTRAVTYSDCTLCRDYNYIRKDPTPGWCEQYCR
ncbi:hypothetical protein ACFFR8_03300 [Streptoalloteichus tenebrarius]